MFSVHYKVAMEYKQDNGKLSYTEHNQAFSGGAVLNNHDAIMDDDWVDWMVKDGVIDSLAQKHHVHPSRIVICNIMPGVKLSHNVYNTYLE